MEAATEALGASADIAAAAAEAFGPSADIAAAAAAAAEEPPVDIAAVPREEREEVLGGIAKEGGRVAEE